MTLKKRILTFFCSLLMCFNIMFGFNVQKANAIAGADDTVLLLVLLASTSYLTYQNIKDIDSNVVHDLAEKLTFTKSKEDGKTVVKAKGKDIKENLKTVQKAYEEQDTFKTDFQLKDFNPNDYKGASDCSKNGVKIDKMKAIFDVVQDAENDYYWYLTLNGEKIVNNTKYIFNGKECRLYMPGSFDDTYIKIRSCYTTQQNKPPYFDFEIHNSELRLTINQLIYLNDTEFKSTTFIRDLGRYMKSETQKADLVDGSREAIAEAVKQADLIYADNLEYTFNLDKDLQNYKDVGEISYNTNTRTCDVVTAKTLTDADTADLVNINSRVTGLEKVTENINTNVKTLSRKMEEAEATLTEALTGLAGSVSDIFDYVIDLPLNIFNALKDSFNSIIDGVRDMLNWFTAPATIELDFTPLQNIELAKKFPFSLPLDIKNAISTFSADPETPSFKVQFPACFYNYELEVNLKDFNFIASISRAFCIIIFNIALIYVTYKFMF